MWIYVVIGIVIMLLIYAFVIHNKLVKINNKVKEAFATMDVYLKKRWDLIPNIVKTVKAYTKHEKETLENIVNLRNNAYDRMDAEDKIDTNEKLTPNISKLMLVAESYPELKANKNFLDLSSQLSKAEEDIANSRKYYNAVVRIMNDKVQMFPSNIFARIFGFKENKFFEVGNSERENIKVKI